jgi:serine/threonine protein phosphatase PrpC
MKVEIICERGSGEVNEDNVLAKGKFFGVFDGATSLDKFMDADGKTGGLIASSIAKNVFENNEGGLVQLTEKANSEIRKEMLKKKVDISKKENLWSTSVAVIKLASDSFDWVQLGDSLIIVIFNDNTFKLLVTDYDHDEEALIMWKEFADKKVENIRKHLKGQLLKVRKTMNVSYGILNGEDEMKNFINKGKDSLDNVKSIIIFTDGLIIPKENPAEKDDFNLLVQLYKEGGLNKIKNYTRELEDSDPNCWKYPRFKQYDDIGAISIVFE